MFYANRHRIRSLLGSQLLSARLIDDYHLYVAPFVSITTHTYLLSREKQNSDDTMIDLIPFGVCVCLPLLRSSNDAYYRLVIRPR